MKTKIREELKADVPQTTWGRILTATPIVMTVIATMLAGLSTSEMTRAQYVRSLAAQQQSKAGDQWSFFQAKRLRGAMQRSTLDLLLLQSTVPIRPLDPMVLRQAVPGELAAVLDSPAGPLTLAALLAGEFPNVPATTAPDPSLKSALEAVESSRSEAEITPLIARLKEDLLVEALRAAKERAAALDEKLGPINQTVDRIEKLLASLPGPAMSSTNGSSLLRDFTAARLRYAALRYDTEARFNQAVAHVYELQVRQSNLRAERHRRRSQQFFFGMLIAQAAVVVSTFSLAAHKRSFLWMLAAGAGLAAIAFSIYVYFYV